MLNGGRVPKLWQPMSELMWVGPISRCASLSAVNTGRSGQPVQNVGGRTGNSPTAASAAGLCAAICFCRATIAAASTPAGLRLGEEAGEAVEQHVGGVFAGLRQHALAVDAGLDVGAAQLGVDRLLDVVGIAFLDHQHGALAGAELAHLLRHQRIGDVEAVDRDARIAEHVGEAEPLQRAQQRRW